jgi:hypothetical protein
MQSSLCEVGFALFRPLIGFPLSLEFSMPHSTAGIFFLSCILLLMILWHLRLLLHTHAWGGYDTKDVGDHQQLPCSNFCATCYACQMCSLSWGCTEVVVRPAGGSSKKVVVWEATSWDFFICPIECPHIFGRDPSAYLYIQDTALLHSNFPSLTSFSLNTCLIFSF